MTPTEIEAGDERRVLAVLFLRTYPNTDRAEWTDLSSRFLHFLGAGAYLDAAMMLVPEGWDWQFSSATGTAHVWKGDGKTQHTFGNAPTPALALCAAIARATPPTA